MLERLYVMKAGAILRNLPMDVENQFDITSALSRLCCLAVEATSVCVWLVGLYQSPQGAVPWPLERIWQFRGRFIPNVLI